MDRWIDGSTDGWMDGQTDRWIDGWMDGQMDLDSRQIGTKIDTETDRQTDNQIVQSGRQKYSETDTQLDRQIEQQHVLATVVGRKNILAYAVFNRKHTAMLQIECAKNTVNTVFLEATSKKTSKYRVVLCFWCIW